MTEPTEPPNEPESADDVDTSWLQMVEIKEDQGPK